LVISAYRRITVGLIVLLISVLSTQIISAQEIPQFPDAYTGFAKLSDGSNVPDNVKILARVLEYESEPVSVVNGKYGYMTVFPEMSRFLSKINDNNECTMTTSVVENYVRSNCVLFYAVIYDVSGTIIIDSVEASEVRPYLGFEIDLDFTLTFDRVPTIPPTPTPIPPTATPIPAPTATPVAAQAAILGGTIIVAGSGIPEGAELIAKVSDYISAPAFIIGEQFINLVIDPVDPKYIDMEIIFFLNGIPSNVTVSFESGGRHKDLEIIFTGMPTPTPIVDLDSTEAEIIPINTTVPSTPVPEPTSVPEPPTPTPPTATPVIAASEIVVEEEPTVIPEEQFFGTCSAPDQKSAPVAQSVANGLLILAPMGLLYAYRRYRKK